MVKKLSLLLGVCLMVSMAMGCGESLKFWKKKKEVEVVHKKLPPFEELFNRTVEMYNTKHYKDAINAFLFLRENYPQKAEYQSRITLYLADSHFHLREYPEAIANYEEFIKLYPKSPDVPYAYFQIGMSNYKQRRGYDRDASFVRKALENFEKVLALSPPGVLVNESIRMIAFCQRELALHDFFIADFYLRTHHYTSAILRYKGILELYPNLKVYDRAHLGIAKAYLKLKEKKKAFRHLSYVAKNFPNTSYGKEAWNLLQKEFKVASRGDLPDVTFEAGKESDSGKTVQEAKSSVSSPRKQAGKKETGEALKKAENKKEPEPHVYFPKISKVRKEPVVVSSPKEEIRQDRKGASSPPNVTRESEEVSANEKSEKKEGSAPRVGMAEKESSGKTPTAKSLPTPEEKVEEQKRVKKGKVAGDRPLTSKVSDKESSKTPSVKGGVESESVRKQKVKSLPSSPKRVEEASKKPVEKVSGKKESVAKNEGKQAQVEKHGEGKPATQKEVTEDQKKVVKKPKKLPKEKGSEGLVGAIDTRLPIHITADHVEAKSGQNSVRFYGNVVAKQKNVTLRCDDLTAYYVKGGKAIDKIVARGKVSITQLAKKVECGRAVFYNAERKIVLDNSPVAWEGGNRISGDKMILYLEKNEIQILGSKNKPSELVIYPEKKPSFLKETK